ncbi:C15orf41 family protein [archaeon]|nr:C15orf41 family protein [archaeon]
MDIHTYKEIYDKLDSSNIKSISQDFEVSGDVLTCILNQKMLRSNKTLYHRVANNSKALLERWEEGEPFATLSAETGLSPVLIASILLKHRGMTRKVVQKMLKNPGAVEDKRLRREIAEVIKGDNLFSPRAHSLQTERARKCEEGIGTWLKEKDITFLTEDEIKKYASTKTPDFLLKSPLDINSTRITWIESKGLFGDVEEHRRYLKKQFSEYIKFFGAGMVVYWYGFVDLLQEENSEILVRDSTYFGVDNAEYIQ